MKLLLLIIGYYFVNAHLLILSNLICLFEVIHFFHFYKKIGNEYSTNPNLKKHENNYDSCEKSMDFVQK